VTRKRFLTPPAIPETDKCRGIVFPDSFQWESVFSAALYETTLAHNYEQVHETDLTPDQAAAEAYARYQAWLEASCDSGVCPPPAIAEKRVVRLHPQTGRFQQVTADGAGFEEPDGDYAVPAQAGRAETEEIDRLCNAAANAAHVMKLLYDQSLADFHNAYSAEEAFDSFGEAAGDIIFAELTALIQGLGFWVAFAWDAFWLGIEIVSQNVWTSAFEDRLKCIFLEHASETDGIVTFDFQAINRQLMYMQLANVDEILWLAQVEYMLYIIGADGLNLAGETTAITGDCDTCGTWCQTWTIANMNGSQWDKFEGTYDLSGWINLVTYGSPYDGALKRLGVRLIDLDTSDCIINSVQALVEKPSGSLSAYLYITATPGTGLTNANPETVVFDNYSSWHTTGMEATDASTSGSTTIYIRFTTNGTSACRLRGIKVTGTGRNPFTTGVTC